MRVGLNNFFLIIDAFTKASLFVRMASYQEKSILVIQKCAGQHRISHLWKLAMDLRNIEEFKTFRATKYVFGMTGDQKFSVTAHKNTPEF